MTPPHLCAHILNGKPVCGWPAGLTHGGLCHQALLIRNFLITDDKWFNPRRGKERVLIGWILLLGGCQVEGGVRKAAPLTGTKFSCDLRQVTTSLSQAQPKSWVRLVREAGRRRWLKVLLSAHLRRGASV